MSDSTARAKVYRCVQCRSKDVEICLPAYFLANGPLEVPLSVDAEADALTYWCPECGENVEVRAPNGEILSGVWD